MADSYAHGLDFIHFGLILGVNFLSVKNANRMKEKAGFNHLNSEESRPWSHSSHCLQLLLFYVLTILDLCRRYRGENGTVGAENILTGAANLTRSFENLLCLSGGENRPSISGVQQGALEIQKQINWNSIRGCAPAQSRLENRQK